MRSLIGVEDLENTGIYSDIVTSLLISLFRDLANKKLKVDRSRKWTSMSGKNVEIIRYSLSDIVFIKVRLELYNLVILGF